jgi:hypothetical protein
VRITAEIASTAGGAEGSAGYDTLIVMSLLDREYAARVAQQLEIA